MRTSAIGISEAQTREGFTLVELMVVIAILALATSVVMLSLPSGAADSRKEAEKVAARLSFTRDLAISDARPREIIFSDGGYQIAGDRARQWKLPKGAEVSGPTTIRFDATGTTGADTRLVVQSGGNQTTVLIDTGGEVHVAP